MKNDIENPWRHLAKAAGQGSIKRLTVGISFQYVKNWVKEEVESVKISIAFLHFISDVYCETDEEVKTLCRVLGFAKEWKVIELRLPDKMGAEGWEALSKVADKGKVNIVIVSKSALRAANNQQVEALWQATDESWEDYDGAIGAIAKKSEGGAGLKKLIDYRSDRKCQLL